MPLVVPQFQPGTHDCYFEYLDANTCRLSRFGGNKLMINGRLETIPAGGLTVAPYSGQAGLDIVQCVALMQSGVMTLSWFNDTIVTDPYGMPVPQSNPGLTLVGLVLGRSATYTQNASTCGAISYFNRKQRAVRTNVDTNGSTASATAVWLSNFYCQTLCFAGDMFRFMGSGYAYSDTAGARSYLDLRVKSPSGEPGADYGNHVYSAGVNWPFGIGPSKDYFAPNTNWYGVSCWASAPNGGTSYWVMNTSILFEG
jgi:hypothetical protein